MVAAISTHMLTRAFSGFTAVDKVTMEIPAGTICGFLGPNGAGKTTLIRMLCGILEPSSGSAQVLGYDIKNQSEAIKKHIGYMSQKFSLYHDLTVKENLDFFHGVYDLLARERVKRVQEMLAQAGLSGRENTMVNQLSPGHRQRLALASALLSRPKLLFLDEPTSGVSPVARREFFNIIQKLSQQGVTIVVSTHFMDEAERCHQIAFMSQGGLLSLGTPEELKQHSLQGFLFEITVSNPRTVAAQIEALPQVSEYFIYGSYLHVLLNDAQAISTIERLYSCTAVEISPSLQEVFLILAKKSLS